MTKSKIVQLVCGYTTFPSDSDRYRCKRLRSELARYAAKAGRVRRGRCAAGPLRVVDL